MAHCSSGIAAPHTNEPPRRRDTTNKSIIGLQNFFAVVRFNNFCFSVKTFCPVITALSKFNLHLLPFGKYKIAYLHLLVKRKYKRKSRFFANRAAIQYKDLKNVFVSNQAGTPAAPTPPRQHPRRSAGEKKSRRPRGEIGSSVKVADPRRKVAKSFGRKSQSRST